MVVEESVEALIYSMLYMYWHPGSAVGGGQQGVSNRFVDGFEYLDKICQMAIHSHTQVNRQTLCGYEYG